MAAPTKDSVFQIKVEKVLRLTSHAGVQIGTKVYNTIDAVKHSADMTTRHDGVLVKMGPHKKVVCIGNIHSYDLADDSTS